MTTQHPFTETINEILQSLFQEASMGIYEKSTLLQYLNIKTKSANKGSKSRGSFANLYAIYVLAEDYIQKGFVEKGGYAKYEGAIFSDLLKRQRELPFGRKLQNHALNHRMNEEYKKYFPTSEYTPILRSPETNRYWLNENLLKIKIGEKEYNLAEAVIRIVDAYVQAKTQALEKFINDCKELETISKKNPEAVESFIFNLLEPNVDARLFEIVSYAVLKSFYSEQKVFFGYSKDEIEEESLMLYKTGRTNANDGGIDYVMRPVGRFFQVTETLDVKKYFLDIDKIEKFPITFVIKSEEDATELSKRLRMGAEQQYGVEKVVESYMNCIEEIINIPEIKERFRSAIQNGKLKEILSEIIKQSEVEFNYEEDDDEEVS